MSASLPLISVPAAQPHGVPATVGNTELNQIDSDISKAFGPILGDAVAALGQVSDSDMAALARDAGLPQALQALPDGGKLLPLISEALDQAVARGEDPRQLLAQVVETLDSLPADVAGAGGQGLTEFMQGFLRELLPQSAQAAGGNQSADDVELPVGAERPAPRPVPAALAAQDRLAQSDARQALPQSDSGEAFEQALLRAQGTAGAESRQIDLAAVLAVMRRHPASPGGLESGPRADAAATAPLQSAGASTAAATSSPALPSTVLSAPFGQTGWDQAVGERIQWMMGQKLQGAQVKLNPAHLGPMEVRVQMNNDQASVHFTAAHGVVREALEQALPRLREMFEASGVELVDVDISGQSFAEQQAMRDEGGSGFGRGAGGDGQPMEAQADQPDVVEGPLNTVRIAGRVDLFA